MTRRMHPPATLMAAIICAQPLTRLAEPTLHQVDQRQLRGAIHSMKVIMPHGLFRVEWRERKRYGAQACPEQIEQPPAKQQPRHSMPGRKTPTAQEEHEVHQSRQARFRASQGLAGQISNIVDVEP